LSLSFAAIRRSAPPLVAVTWVRSACGDKARGRYGAPCHGTLGS
jgi:hypothetical protein